MPTPFAALEARVNASCMSHLANAVATWQAAGGGDPVDADVIVPLPYFDNAASAIDAVDHIRCFSSTFPACAGGDTITLDNGREYRVRSVEPEALDTGLKRINLARDL